MTSFAIRFLILIVLVTTHPCFVSATEPNKESENENRQEIKENGEQPHSAATQQKPSVFPNHLDISSLQNMPLIILHPRTPINFEMLPGDNLESIHKALNPSRILELLQSATFSTPARIPPSNAIHDTNKEARNINLGNRQPQASVKQPVSSPPDSQFKSPSDSQFNDPALPRSLMNPHPNGWFQRFRGSFSNMFPVLRPAKEGPFPLSLPSIHLPVIFPQHGPMHGTISPFAMSSLQQFQSLPWKNAKFHNPSLMHIGDLNTGASHLSPLRTMFGNHHLNHFNPTGFPQHPFGGDLATSGSAFIPRHVIPPPSFGRFIPPHPPAQRHKPLFNNMGGLQAASMEISNAFADFTDSKEHGPEVTQKFGSVGHSINTFLKMMGLGSDLSFGGVGGFGGGADLASMDSTPIARSLDYYPGYGNQAHLDDLQNLDEIGDFPEFMEDITEKFMKEMNLTNGTSSDEVKKMKEAPKKEPVKAGMESMEKDKTPVIKEPKDKSSNNKQTISIGERDASYATAEKMKDDKLPEKHIEQPLVNYKIPPIRSTVAPQDRKKPIAIYQHFDSNGEEAPKPPAYAPAQEMPKQEGEDNPNKLVDEDVVRQWRLVNRGQGYAEKRPVPILDILQTSMQPEGLKVLKKVVSDVKKDSS